MRCGCVAHDTSDAVRRINSAVAQRLDKEKGVLILTDMFGGTPANLALSLLGHYNVEVVTGVNLPMAMKVFSSRNTELDKLAQLAEDAGKDGIFVGGKHFYRKKQKLILTRSI